MEITSFNINNNTLTLEITNADSLVSLYLWDETTYKDFSKGIDLSGKLTGSATENITITLQDINQSTLDGIYFIEAQDTEFSSLKYTYNFTRYKECILDKIVKNIQCRDCMDYLNVNIINSHSLLIATEYALELGYIEVALNNIKVLNKYCSNECSECDSYSNVIDNNLFTITDV